MEMMQLEGWTSRKKMKENEQEWEKGGQKEEGENKKNKKKYI